MSLEEENKQLMKTLDDAWNNQDWDTFSQRHTENVIVKWPGQFEPTRGLDGIEMKAFKCLKHFLTTMSRTIHIK